MKPALKRVYEPASESDGCRVLVDRLWPRGLSKAEVHVDHWLKDLSPSNALRKTFHHDPDRWDAFVAAYGRELAANTDAVDVLRKLMAEGKVTLLYAARDTRFNNAVALRDWLDAHP